jgi:hypothetical protein
MPPGMTSVHSDLPVYDGILQLLTQAVPALTNFYVPRRDSVKRVAISHKRNVIIRGCVPEQPKIVTKEKSEICNFIAWNKTFKRRKQIITKSYRNTKTEQKLELIPR